MATLRVIRVVDPVPLYLTTTVTSPMKRRCLSFPVLLVLASVLCAFDTHAQYFRQSDYWKTQRQELSVGFGLSNFLGELGGRNQIGSPFLWDLEVSQTRPAVHFDYRYFAGQAVALRARATYGVMAGNDNLTTELFRQNRNLSFKSDLYEVSLVLEVHPYKEELGHVHSLRGVKGERSTRVGLYAFAGIAGLYFDPKAPFENTWVRLKPLGTEGQGLPNGAPEYSNISWGIPMGVGVRKALTKQMSLGLEIQYTKTFTDYIDDVSTEYYDNTALSAARGELAAFLADPSLGLSDIVGDPTAAGQQRGDPDDLDAYLFMKMQIHYKLIKYKSGNKKYRTRIRRQKIVF